MPVVYGASSFDLSEKTLDEPQAFFLGALLIDNEMVSPSGTKWLANFRHNRGQATPAQVKDHKASIEALAHKVGGAVEDITSQFDGFTVTISFPRPTEISQLISAAQSIKDSDSINLKKAFLAGVFDGKSSFDRAIESEKEHQSQLVVDCPRKNGEQIYQIISSMLEDVGIAAGDNQARKRKAGGEDRKVQIRLGRAGTETFCKTVGFTSAFRLYRAGRLYEDCEYFVDSLPNLPGLKKVSAEAQKMKHRQIVSPITDRKLLSLENLKDQLVIEKSTDQKQEAKPRIWGDAPVEKPKKASPAASGAASYERSSARAHNALAYSGFKCEIDPEHRTFLRKTDGTPYTEPHHLIPMAYQEQFDYSIDIEENIVSLCSVCHDEIHYGLDRERLLKPLFESRQDRLQKMGIDITYDELRIIYGVQELPEA